MTDTQYDNVVALYVKDYAIIADAETVAAQFRIGQPLGILERIVFEAKEGRTDTFFDAGIKALNVSNGFVCMPAGNSMPEYLIVHFNPTGMIVCPGFFYAVQVLRGGCRKQFLQEPIAILLVHGFYSANDLLP